MGVDRGFMVVVDTFLNCRQVDEYAVKG